MSKSAILALCHAHDVAWACGKHEAWPLSAVCMARCAILVALATFACELAAHANDNATANPDPARFAAEIRAFEAWDRQNSVPLQAVLFVGSSSIRMWPTAECFPHLAVINRGFGGSHASDVNHFADRIVLKYAPRVIVFYAGDNDIEAGKPPQQVFDDFRAFARIVHERLPQTNIVYLPIKPSLARWGKWPRMQDVNSRAQKLSQSDPRIVYVDTATPMLGSDGRPRSELFRDDGLHLNEQGYRLWTEILAKNLKRTAAEQ
jgi:lysophospholipase L1-like esterase